MGRSKYAVEEVLRLGQGEMLYKIDCVPPMEEKEAWRSASLLSWETGVSWHQISIDSPRQQYFCQLTGVRSRSESASVAEAAASISSSHLLPCTAAVMGAGGSAEKAFLPSMLYLLPYSFDLVFSCLGLRLF